MLFLNEAIPEGFSSTSCIKHWGLSGYLKLFCPASAFATADSEVARNPQRFIHVTVRRKLCLTNTDEFNIFVRINNGLWTQN